MHTINIRHTNTRAVHGSVWVGFVPNPESGGEKRHPPPTRRSNRVERFKTSTGGGRVDRIWDGKKTVEKTQIRRKSHRIQWDFAKSSENLTGFDEISSDPVKISSDLREIVPESGKISSESGFFCRILENLAGIWKSFGPFGFFGF